jgi:hypothetical protein
MGRVAHIPSSLSGLALRRLWLAAAALSRALCCAVAESAPRLYSAGKQLIAHACALADIDANPERALHREQLTQLPRHCGVCALDCCAQRGPGC